MCGSEHDASHEREHAGKQHDVDYESGHCVPRHSAHQPHPSRSHGEKPTILRQAIGHPHHFDWGCRTQSEAVWIWHGRVPTLDEVQGTVSLELAKVPL